MPIRVKNVAHGMTLPGGKFIPLHSYGGEPSPDYDKSYDEDYAKRRKRKAKAKTKAKPKRKAAAKRRAAPKRKAAPRKRAVKRATAKRRTVKRAVKRVSRSRNPIPTKFTSAKVRRLASGDIQVLITG